MLLNCLVLHFGNMKYWRLFVVLVCAVSVILYYKVNTPSTNQLFGIKIKDAEIKYRHESSGNAHLEQNMCSQASRRRLLNEMCVLHEGRVARTDDDIDLLSDEQVRKFVSDIPLVSVDKYKLLMCINWKAASTTWVSILLNNTMPGYSIMSYEDTERAMNEGPFIRWLDKYTIPEIRFRLKTYFKFMNIRHPLDRLVSVYNERLVAVPQIRRDLGPKILSKYRKNVSTHDLKEGLGVSFTEFLQFVVDDGVDVGHHGEHWHSQLTRCQPCRLQYHFLSRLETMARDASFFIQEKLAGHLNKYTHKERRPFSTEEYAHFGRSLPEFQSVPQALFDQIVDKYKWDMRSYGYDFKRRNGTVITECKLPSDEDTLCC